MPLSSVLVLPAILGIPWLQMHHFSLPLSLCGVLSVFKITGLLKSRNSQIEEMLRARYVRKDGGVSTPSLGVLLAQHLYIFTTLGTPESRFVVQVITFLVDETQH